MTGASAGLGRAVALALARQGLHVLVAARAPAAGQRVVQQIEAAGQGSAELLLADLAQLAQVRALAEAACARAPRLDVLVLNAGLISARRSLTPDGHETTLAVNHLAHYLLARGLHGSLVAASAVQPPARVLVVSSSAHATGQLDWGDPTLARAYAPLDAYARSKLANVLFAREAARRWAAAGVTVNALHPGGLRTGIARELPWFLRLMVRVAFASPERAAADIAWLATSAESARVSGAYFVGRRQHEPGPAACDEAAAREAWGASARLVGLPPD